MSTALFFFSCNRVQQRLAPINCDSLSVVGLGVGLGLVANQKPEEVCKLCCRKKKMPPAPGSFISSSRALKSLLLVN